MVGFRSHRPLTRVVEYVGVLLEVSMLPPCSKLVWPRDWSGKQKASSPPDVPPPPKVDLATLRQHMRIAGERRSKAREDARRVYTSKSRELSRHGSPLVKRGHVIEVSTSEEAPEELKHSRGMSDQQQSWRYVTLSPPNYTLPCFCQYNGIG